MPSRRRLSTLDHGRALGWFGEGILGREASRRLGVSHLTSDEVSRRFEVSHLTSDEKSPDGLG